MIALLRSLTKVVFDQPALYEGLRTFFLGGLPYKPMFELLDATDSDIILDVACGTGHLAKQIPFKRYIGFDHDAKCIEVARNRKIPKAIFTQEDVSVYPFEEMQPTKAILSGVLHHLSDEEARGLLKTLARTVSRWIVTNDPVYAKYHALNNLLCRLDRGKYVRTKEQMEDLMNGAGLKPETELIRYSNTLMTKHITFRLIPQ